MKNYKIILISLFSGFVIALPCFADSQKLTIVFSGDMRGEIENCHCPKDDFGGLDRRSKYISSVREELDDILLLDTGDILPLHSPDVTENKISYIGFISFKAMSSMGYDVMNVGETDLILGEGFLTQYKEEIQFSLVSANIVNKNTRTPSFDPYVIKTMKNGLRVGIIGLINERYVLNSEQLEILPNKEVASKYIPEIRSQSDIVIVLGHLGLPYSINLAESIDGIDVILSGHWDVDSQEPIKINNTLIMPTTYHSRKIGKIDLEVGSRGISSYNWESTPLDEAYDGNKLVEAIVSEMPESVKLVTEQQGSSQIPAQIEEIAAERPLKVLVFYSTGCRACMEIERDLLPDIEQKYGDAIAIEQYDIGLPENYEQMTRLEKLYGIEGGGYVPEVVVSRYVLMGKEEIFSRLDEAIHDALEEPIDVKKKNELGVAEYHPPASSLILSRFESFSTYAVLTAGLLDGVNPCAFTTIVFFISFLAFMGYRRREMFFAGTFFTLAVFITYLLIGIGIFRFLRAMKAFSYVAVFVNILIGALAFLLGILSLIDYLRFRKTKDAKAVILKLPQSIRNKIHSLIGTDFRINRSLERKNLARIAWVAFTAGFMVSILESFCTGQVYLPTLAFVLRMPGKKISALLYLFLYNLAFITPLIIVFLLGLFGATSNTFSRFMEKRLGTVKLATAALFFLLGAILVIFR
jgi:hypothetical protein